MKQKITSYTGLALIALGLLIVGGLMEKLTSPVDAQGITQRDNRNVGDWQFVTINVIPQENATNTIQAFDNTYTNFFRVSPINATLQWQYQGTLNTAMLATNIIVTNNAGTTRTLNFRNGLLTAVQ